MTCAEEQISSNLDFQAVKPVRGDVGKTLRFCRVLCPCGRVGQSDRCGEGGVFKECAEYRKGHYPKVAAVVGCADKVSSKALPNRQHQ